MTLALIVPTSAGLSDEKKIRVEHFEQAEKKKRPVIILAPGGLSDAMEGAHRANGVAIFHEIASCFESLNAYDCAVNRAAEAGYRGVRRSTAFRRECDILTPAPDARGSTAAEGLGRGLCGD